MKLLYFAKLRETLGVGEEDIPLPVHVATVGDLIAWLKTRGDTFAQALDDGARIQAAVNQVHAKPDTPVQDSDEVALFPPVTGG